MEWLRIETWVGSILYVAGLLLFLDGIARTRDATQTLRRATDLHESTVALLKRSEGER